MNKDPNCIFCKIIAKEIPATILFENENLIVLQDIKPSAPIHHLVIPRDHIQSVAHLEEKNKDLIGEIFLIANEDANKVGLKGYKTVFNVGRDGGQVIDHLHLHLLGGWSKREDIEKMPSPKLDK
ncbi:MAG: HIT domain-containing protein [Candidatus Paceibacterota bacterium]